MNHSEIEQKIIKVWKNDNVFQKQISQNINNKTFTFYDGPPFATGLPHYGHIVASTIKDIVPRYWSMCGYNVPRKWGWDCIAEGSLINLADGTSIAIEKFDFLANVETYDIDEKIYTIRNKKQFWNKGKKECIELTFDNKTTLICTNDHQIFTNKGWIEAKNIKSDMEIYSAPINPEFYYNNKYWECHIDHVILSTDNIIITRKSAAYCRILGYMIAGGNNFNLLVDVRNFINDIQLVFKEHLEYIFNSNYKVIFSHNLQFLENYKNIPKIFTYDNTPNIFKQEFLSGFFSGAKTTDNILWKDQKYFKELTYLLTNLGVFVDIQLGNFEISLSPDDIPIYHQKIGYRYNNAKKLPTSKLKIISTKEVGLKTVYDISVNETHNFIANGIVVHNCHGLPIEFEIEKKLGIKTKSEILKLGIAKYNEACRSIVMNYSREWKKTIERIGRWVDMENDYKTMDLSYMDKVWNIFYQLYEKNLVYQGVKVMPYSTGCTTPLSNFEAKSNYKKVQDPSIVIKFTQKNTKEAIHFLVWTTTPWTLPSNQALCINPLIDYVVAEKDKELYILMASAAEKYGFTNIIKKIDAVDLIGLAYEPLFNYFPNKNGFIIVADNYVSNETGTGIVHLAPAFGEDDYRVCLENDVINKMIIPPCPFDANGYFTSQVDFLKGKYFKDADKIVIKELKEKIFNFTTEHHDYPYCWRSETPLMYRIVPCTFINVEAIKDKIVEVNSKETNWVPEHIKDGRFGMWLKEARDWCVSRNRYWGTPIPIWKSEDGDVICISGVEELEKLTGKKIIDIHRHHIDNIVFEKDGKTYKRIEEVFDCWFESGSVPFTAANYPADFIAEGLDQTRGWFYTLMVLGVAINGSTPFKNVIVNGLVLAEDGEKMSKSKKNFPDPNMILDKYGADALRLYLISQGIVRGDSLKFKEEGVKMMVQNFHQFAYNTLNFLKQMIPLYEQKYFNKFKFFTLDEMKKNCKNMMDMMLLNYLQEFVDSIHQEMRAYNLGNIVGKINKFIGQLSRTYLNMNKSRLKSILSEEEGLTSLNTLFYVFKIFSVMIAPFVPFMSENFYQELRLLEGHIDFNSVHLERLPEKVWDKNDFGQECINLLETIIEARGEMRTVLKSAKKPIKRQIIYINNWRLIPFLEGISETLMSECNILELDFSSRITEMVFPIYEINMQLLGKRFRGEAKNVKIEIEKYLRDKKVENGRKEIKIGGKNEIFEEEIKVVYKLDEKKIGENHVQFYKEKEIMILSDLSWDEELQEIYIKKLIMRELMNVRKEMGLIPTDSAKVMYKNMGDGMIIEDNLWKLYELLNMPFQEYNEKELGTKYKKLYFEEEGVRYEFIVTI